MCYHEARGENERGCEIERKSLRACERDFHNLGKGVEGHRSNRWSPRGGADAAAASWFRHLNIPIVYEAWREEEVTPKGHKQRGSQSYSVSIGSAPPCPRTLWVDQPAPPTPPPTPAALSLQLPVTGPGERGGGESHSHLVQSDQRGLRWGRGGSCVPPHQ